MPLLQVSREVNAEMFDRIASAYLHHLVDSGNYEEAAACMPDLLKVRAH